MFADAVHTPDDLVVGLLITGQGRVRGLLDWMAQGGVEVRLAQLGERGQAVLVHGALQRSQQIGLGPGAGGVVLAAGGPQRPPVRGGQHLNGAAVVFVLARPPETGVVGAGGADPVGADDGAVPVEMGASLGLCLFDAGTQAGARAASTLVPSRMWS